MLNEMIKRRVFYCINAIVNNPIGDQNTPRSMQQYLKISKALKYALNIIIVNITTGNFF